MLIVFELVTLLVGGSSAQYTAMIGLYSPYLSSLAQQLQIVYYVVGTNDNTPMPLSLMELYYQSQVFK